jgi:nitrogen fixation protein NifZ
MNLDQPNPGDIVYAAKEIRNDGGIPEIPDDAVIAVPGTRGVVVNIGHLERDPQRELFLVRFEDADLNLGPPTGCWPEELSAEPTG